MELVPSNKITMTTVEIAQLTGKNHNHVRADCRKMFSELEIEADVFSSPFKMPSGQNIEVFNLDPLLTRTLITGYSKEERLEMKQSQKNIKG